MRDVNYIRILRIVSVLVLAVVFGWSGGVKVLDPEAFSLSVYRFHLLPAWAVNGASLWIGMLELVCAVVLLCVPRWRRAALWVLVALLFIFITGLAVNLFQGNRLTCGCFSSSPMAAEVGWIALVRNLVLMGVAGYVLRRDGARVACGSGS